MAHKKVPVAWSKHNNYNKIKIAHSERFILQEKHIIAFLNKHEQLTCWWSLSFWTPRMCCSWKWLVQHCLPHHKLLPPLLKFDFAVLKILIHNSGNAPCSQLYSSQPVPVILNGNFCDAHGLHTSGKKREKRKRRCRLMSNKSIIVKKMKLVMIMRRRYKKTNNR